MMQSQGLGALMPQAAQQMAPQQADPQRLAAATNLVSSDAEKQILDPRTLALIKYKDALQAMQAADQMMAAAQPAPMPPTVAERTKLAAEQGIAGLASKLGAGIQQQGNNMQAQQMQQAMSGGLPQLPAPNMAGMAQGGIVGFDAGGGVEGSDKIIGRLPDGTLVYASDMPARNRDAAAGIPVEPITPVDKRAQAADVAARNREAAERLISAAPQTPEVQQQQTQMAAQQPRGVGTLNIEAEIDRLMRPATQTQATAQQDTEEQVVYDASGRPTLQRYAQQPTQDTSPEQVAAATPAPAEPSSRYTEDLEAILKQVQGKTFDEEAAADARAAELRRLTGADDLVAQRAEAERSRRELAETRFSPEAQRRRALRAGLAGLAERGLGGFSSGAGAEDERIYAEQSAERERSVAEMDRLIADFRQMGMTEFEARNAARTAVQGQEETQQQRQTDILTTLSESQDAAEGRAIQRENIDAQLEVARINASNAGRLSQFDQVFSTLISKAVRDNPGIDMEDAKVLALEEYYAREESVARGRLGLQESGSDLGRKQAVEEHMLNYVSSLLLSGMSKDEQDQAVAAERARVSQLYGVTPGAPAAPTTAGVPPQYATNFSTGERIVSTDGGVNWQPVQ